MKCRYTIYIIVTFIIQAVLWYYVMCFCAVFQNSNKSWLFGALIGNTIDTFAFKPSYSIIKGIIRLLAMKCTCWITIKIYSLILWISSFL